MEQSISTKNSNSKLLKNTFSQDFAKIQKWDESVLSNNLDLKSQQNNYSEAY